MVYLHWLITLQSPAQAASHWELALAVNPLHSEGWFALGYCCIKASNFGRALQAFSRAAQQEPENGDAWNNLAAIHLQVPPGPSFEFIITMDSKSHLPRLLEKGPSMLTSQAFKVADKQNRWLQRPRTGCVALSRLWDAVMALWHQGPALCECIK